MQQSCYLVRDANERALAYVLSQRQPWLSSRRGCAADDLRTRIVLIEVAISEAQPRDRAAEPAMVDPLHPETRLDRQTVEVCAHRAVLYLEGAGRQCREAYLAAAHRPDGADHGAVGKDSAHADGAVDAECGPSVLIHIILDHDAQIERMRRRLRNRYFKLLSLTDSA